LNAGRSFLFVAVLLQHLIQRESGLNITLFLPHQQLLLKPVKAANVN